MWDRLINDPLTVHERVSLIAMIFSDSNKVKMVSDLPRRDTQIFVDKINEVGSHARSHLRLLNPGWNPPPPFR